MFVIWYTKANLTDSSTAKLQISSILIWVNNHLITSPNQSSLTSKVGLYLMEKYPILLKIIFLLLTKKLLLFITLVTESNKYSDKISYFLSSTKTLS